MDKVYQLEAEWDKQKRSLSLVKPRSLSSFFLSYSDFLALDSRSSIVLSKREYDKSVDLKAEGNFFLCKS